MRRLRTPNRPATDAAPRTLLAPRATARRTVVIAVAVMIAVAIAGHAARAQVVAAGRVAQDRQPEDRRPTVAVLYFHNTALMQNADYEPLRKGITDMLITELARNDSIRVIERDRLQQLLEEQGLSSSDHVDPETAVRVGKLLGVHHVILGAYLIQKNGQTRFDARVESVETGQVESGVSVRGKVEDLETTISALAEALNRKMRLPDMPARARPAPAGDLRHLILYARAMDAQDAKKPQQAVALYKEFLAQSPPDVLGAQRKLAEERMRRMQAGYER